jgi:hypothetical protein
VRDPIRRLEAPTQRPSVRGKSWRSTNWPADRSRLKIGDDAVELVDGDLARTIRADQVHAVLAYENGLRHLLTADGYGLTVNPHAWRGGTSAVPRIDDLVDEDRLLPQPPVEGIDQGVRAGRWRRWSAFLMSQLARPAVLGAVLIPLILAIWIGGFVVIATQEISGVGAIWAILGGSALFGAIRGLNEMG